MSIASAIASKQQQVAAAYTACDEKGATMPAAGSQNLSNLASTISTISGGGPAPATKQYTVTWYDYDGTVLKEDTVDEGGSSTAPTVPSHQHLTFREWVHGNTITNVTQDYFNIARHAYLDDGIMLKVNIGAKQDYSLTVGIERETSNADPIVFDWGDGNTETYTTSGWNVILSHTYSSEYTGFIEIYSSSGAKVANMRNNSTIREIGVEEYYYGAKTILRNTAYWGHYNQYIKAIVFPDTLTVLPTDMFSMWMPKVLAFPPSFTSFGDNNGTLHINRNYVKERLEAVNIPASVTHIRHYTFVDCSSLKYVTADIKATSIGNQAFHGCKNLNQELVFSGNVTSIGGAVFRNCGVRKVSFSNSTFTSLPNSGGGVFENCTQLEDVSLPSSLTTLGGYTFLTCTKLKSISLKNLTSVGRSEFYGCTSLEEAELDGTYTTVGIELFRNCTSLKTVKLAATLTTLNNDMFNGCTELENITFPAALTTINNAAMNGLKSITSVTVPDSVTSLGQYFLNGANSLLSLHIGLNMPMNTTYFLTDCRALEELDCTNGWIPSAQFTFTYPTISASVWETFFTHLGDNTGNTAVTLKIGTENLNKLTTAQKEIATNKNYTLIA